MMPRRLPASAFPSHRLVLCFRVVIPRLRANTPRDRSPKPSAMCSPHIATKPGPALRDQHSALLKPRLDVADIDSKRANEMPAVCTRENLARPFVRSVRHDTSTSQRAANQAGCRRSAAVVGLHADDLATVLQRFQAALSVILR